MLAEPPARELRYDATTDLAVTASGGALWIASELLKPELAPASCRWCDRNADGTDSLNGVDDGVRRALRWSNPDVADTASYVAAFGLAPMAAYGLDALSAVHDGSGAGFLADALVITEATVLAADVNQVVKFIAGRERPFVHALPPDQRATTAQPADNNLSFFSGHTTLAFALATSSGTVALMRGYRLAPLVWSVGMSIAAASGYFRIAADRHYFTDVLAGAVAGGGIGFAVPFFFHGPRHADEAAIQVSTSPVVGGQAVVIRALW